jgi:hypothetical protein
VQKYLLDNYDGGAVAEGAAFMVNSYKTKYARGKRIT